MNALTMEPMKFAKQNIDLQKNMFNNIYDAMITYQEQAEKMANTFLDQAPWLPEDGKKAINEVVKTYNKGCKDYKKMINDGFDNMEKFLPED